MIDSIELIQIKIFKLLLSDIFISYSSSDSEIAKFIHRNLADKSVSAFLAETSLVPGQRWSDEILDSLRLADTVIFLASKQACHSPWVQQELGYAIGAKKKLIPIVWDMRPTELPGWVSGFQALDLSNHSVEQVQHEMASIADRIKTNKKMRF